MRGNSLPNEQFWSEWGCYKDAITLELRDLFNRIFVMESTLRLPLRDILRHSWVTAVDGLTSEMVQREMIERSDSHSIIIWVDLAGFCCGWSICYLSTCSVVFCTIIVLTLIIKLYNACDMLNCQYCVVLACCSAHIWCDMRHLCRTNT